MKKIILTLSIFFFTTTFAHACDICGSGSGSGYNGILPDFSKCITGIRHRYNGLQSHLGTDGNATYLTSHEKYHTLEIWGGWAISNKIRMVASFPYSFNEKAKQGVVSKKDGISDFTFTGYYRLLNKQTTILNKKLLTQTVWMGGGIKLPTGEYNHEDKSIDNQNSNLFQLGTASVDYSLAIMYDARLQNSGVNVSAMYKLNNGNKYSYRYGNKFNISTQAYHKFTLWGVAIAPNAGLQFETAQQDSDNNYKVDLSGGHALLGTLGTEASIGKIAIGANFQTALSQHLANGFVKAGNRMMVHVSFAL